MERLITEIAPDPATFERHVDLVEAFVRSQPGARAALMAEANADPEAMTMSIVALGAVLLDLAAGAFHMSPEAMLESVARNVHAVVSGQPPALA